MKIFEIQKSSDEEYSKLVKNRFGAHQSLMYNAEFSKQMLSNMYPYGTYHTEKSDSGNFVTQWFDSGEKIFLVGIITKSGKLERDDVPDFRQFIQNLLYALASGKSVVTSPNEKSMRFVNNLRKHASQMGISLDISTSDGHDFGDDPELRFKTVVITAS